MTPSIAVLPDEVVDQIAAGEVVERPASVAKELIENALDAGATSIGVDIERGGKTLIRVRDNGCGMTGAELELALRRHATSKLRTVDDLYRLRTLGFRGEALPSITAVSKVAITTRAAGAVGALRMEIDGGRIQLREQVGAPVGTTVEVRDLLFNVPARQKFLKGDATETAHITDTVSKLAMANPSVGFVLKNANRTTLSAPRHSSALERTRAVFGSRLCGALHEAAREEMGICVSAFLASPERAQTTSRGARLFVGRRPVRDRGLLHAVCTGYGELLPRGKYPIAAVFVDVPDPNVDVNVHPQKLEVRFADAQAVYAVVRHTVSDAVASAPWLTEVLAEGSAPVRMEVIASDSPPYRASEMAASYVRHRERRLLPLAARARRLERVSFPVAPAETPPEPDLPRTVKGVPVANDFFSRLRYIGQLDRTYLVCEADGEMVLIDQHAAHERVEFQRLKQRAGEGPPPVQRLLFPQRLELSEAQSAAAVDAAEALTAVGFELEPFGGNSFSLAAVPAGLRGEPDRVLGQLLSELSECGGSRAVEERLDRVLATIACHMVVRAGDVLEAREVDALLGSMDEVDYRAHCPHGRPVLLRIGIGEIARRFGR